MTDARSQTPPAAPPQPSDNRDHAEPDSAAATQAVAERPAWLPRKSTQATPPPPPSNSARRPRRRAIRIVPVETEAEPTPWWKTLVRTVVSALGVGFGISLLVHVTMLVGFGLWILDLDNLLSQFSINSGVENEGIEVKVDTEMEVELAESKKGGPIDQKETLINPSELVTRNDEIKSDIPADLESRINKLAAEEGRGGNASGSGTGDTDGGAKKGGARVGRNAVTRGRFTVWSVPSNPDVLQSYLIGIRVQLPEKVKRFRVDDLSGMVSGDKDGHRQTIPHDRQWGPPKVRYRGKFINLRKTGYVPVRTERGKKYATIYIWVPGSQIPKTTDTVRIRSKMLNDEQRLKIVF